MAGSSNLNTRTFLTLVSLLCISGSGCQRQVAIPSSAINQAGATDSIAQSAIQAKKSLFAKLRDGEDVNRRAIEETMALVDKALKEDGSNLQLLREAADFYFHLGKYPEAISQLESLSELDRSQITVDDQLRHAECLQRHGGHANIDKAIELLGEMVGFDEDSKQFSTSNATAPAALKAYALFSNLMLNYCANPDLAHAGLDQMVTANPSNTEAYLARAKTIRQIRENEAGHHIYLADVRKAYELDPTNTTAIVAMCRMQLETDKNDAAIETARQGLTVVSDSIEKAGIYDMLADAHLAKSDFPSALAALQKGLESAPTNRDLMWKKADLLIDQAITTNNAQHYEEVESMYERLDRGKSRWHVMYLQARILKSRDGDVEKANQILKRLKPLAGREFQEKIDKALE